MLPFLWVITFFIRYALLFVRWTMFNIVHVLVLDCVIVHTDTYILFVTYRFLPPSLATKFGIKQPVYDGPVNNGGGAIHSDAQVVVIRD